MYIFTFFALLLSLTACASTSGTSDAGENTEEVVVNIGVQGQTGILPYARENKYFEEAFEKVGVKVTWNEFTSGPPHFEALASGRIDFGAVGGTPVIAGQSGDVDFRAIGEIRSLFLKIVKLKN
jgi:sulfonate transport system substrate-binding protein